MHTLNGLKLFLFHLLPPLLPSKSSETFLQLNGIPELIFSDNGTSFTSDEFKEFVTRNGIRHRTSSPYHPATNGLAERAVQLVKSGLRNNTKGELELRLARILFKYRNTPHSTTGVKPAELLLGCKPRTHLDLLHPDIAPRVEKKQAAQKEAHDNKKPERFFEVGDRILARNFQKGEKWLTGQIEIELGPQSYFIKLSSGKIVRRHLDHVQIRSMPESESQLPELVLPPIEEANNPLIVDNPVNEPVQNPNGKGNQSVHRSSRHRNPPNRYSPHISKRRGVEV